MSSGRTGEPAPGASEIRAPSPSSLALFNRRVETAKEARAWLDTFLRRSGLGGRVVEDAVLVVSELVTNALRHGEGEAVVRASLRGDVIQLSVTDSGDDLPAQQPIDFARVGGLGLHVVERVSAEWGVSPFPGGKTVWAVIPQRHAALG
jgi:anti-sigma regulatory factor (Ser/Thr protein kinase)